MSPQSGFSASDDLRVTGIVIVPVCSAMINGSERPADLAEFRNIDLPFRLGRACKTPRGAGHSQMGVDKAERGPEQANATLTKAV